MASPPTLHELIGQTIIVHVPRIHPTKWQQFRLLNVEPSGLWVESQAMSEAVMQVAGVTSTPKTMITFLPFHEIAAIYSSLDVPSVSDRALL
jgi:hypothetical protein